MVGTGIQMIQSLSVHRNWKTNFLAYKSNEGSCPYYDQKPQCDAHNPEPLPKFALLVSVLFSSSLMVNESVQRVNYQELFQVSNLTEPDQEFSGQIYC